MEQAGDGSAQATSRSPVGAGAVHARAPRRRALGAARRRPRRRSCCWSRPSAVVLVANLPVLPARVAHRDARASPARMVVVDLALVTAAVVFSGGALSPAAVFYVWPIILATVFLPAWAPYATAVAAGAGVRGRLGAASRSTCSPVRAWSAEADVTSTWMLITVCLHIAAFLLVALLAGRLANALVKSTVQLTHRQGRHRRAAAPHEGHQRAAARDEREQPGVPPAPGRGRADAGRPAPGDGRHRHQRRLRPRAQPQHRRAGRQGRRSAPSTRRSSAGSRSSAWSSWPAAGPRATTP